MAAAARLPIALQNIWTARSAHLRFQRQAAAVQARPEAPRGFGAKSCTRSGLRHSDRTLKASGWRRLVVASSSSNGSGPGGGKPDDSDEVSGLRGGHSSASLKVQMELLGALLVR
jgi:hypothetical protein